MTMPGVTPPKLSISSSVADGLGTLEKSPKKIRDFQIERKKIRDEFFEGEDVKADKKWEKVCASLSERLREDAEKGNWIAARRHRCHRALQSKWFEPAVSAVILLNSIVIGLEITYEELGWTEYCFLAIYCVELGAHFFAYGHSCLKC